MDNVKSTADYGYRPDPDFGSRNIEPDDVANNRRPYQRSILKRGECRYVGPRKRGRKNKVRNQGTHAIRNSSASTTRLIGTQTQGNKRVATMPMPKCSENTSEMTESCFESCLPEMNINA